MQKWNRNVTSATLAFCIFSCLAVGSTFRVLVLHLQYLVPRNIRVKLCDDSGSLKHYLSVIRQYW